MSTACVDNAEDITLSQSQDVKSKQQRKEEGRRRALAISVARQHANGAPKAEKTNDKRATRKSARHGARNQHRHKIFAKWVLERFPHVLEECIHVNADKQTSSESADSSSTEHSTQMHILDVAGGKGELSARLSLCHSLHVVMIDPRPADIESVYLNSVVPKLPNKWQTSIKERLQQSPAFVQELVDEKFTQLVMPFTSPSESISPFIEDIIGKYQDEKLDVAVSNASLLIGLHADGATEAIVDAALLYGKPFIIVPCCVFPNLFRERYISVQMETTLQHGDGEADHRDEEGAPKLKKIQVRTHEQFCKYLVDKDPRFVQEVLPFEGRNIAIWWDGK